ncbi:MAG: PH domain-containing protein [Bacilli bacterium]
MAFVKYKELTHYFNFFKEIDYVDCPSYIKDYIVYNERVLAVYKTHRDHGVFTNRKIILFDQRGIGNIKEITTIPYSSITAASIRFKETSVDIAFNLNSGYPLRLKFIRLNPEGKKRLRLLYTNIQKELINKD